MSPRAAAQAATPARLGTSSRCHDVVHVHLGGLLADAERRADLPVRAAGGDLDRHLPLPRRQLDDRLCPAPGRRHPAGQVARRGRRHGLPACRSRSAAERAQHAVEALVEVGQVPRLGLGREGRPLADGRSRGSDEPRGGRRCAPGDGHLGHRLQALGRPAPVADLVVQPLGRGRGARPPVDIGGAPPAQDRRGEQAGADRDGPVVVDRVEQVQRLA